MFHTQEPLDPSAPLPEFSATDINHSGSRPSTRPYDSSAATAFKAVADVRKELPAVAYNALLGQVRELVLAVAGSTGTKPWEALGNLAGSLKYLNLQGMDRRFEELTRYRNDIKQTGRFSNAQVITRDGLITVAPVDQAKTLTPDVIEKALTETCYVLAFAGGGTGYRKTVKDGHLITGSGKPLDRGLMPVAPISSEDERMGQLEHSIGEDAVVDAKLALLERMLSLASEDVREQAKIVFMVSPDNIEAYKEHIEARYPLVHRFAHYELQPLVPLLDEKARLVLAPDGTPQEVPPGHGDWPSAVLAAASRLNGLSLKGAKKFLYLQNDTTAGVQMIRDAALNEDGKSVMAVALRQMNSRLGQLNLVPDQSGEFYLDIAEDGEIQEGDDPGYANLNFLLLQMPPREEPRAYLEGLLDFPAIPYEKKPAPAAVLNTRTLKAEQQDVYKPATKAYWPFTTFTPNKFRLLLCNGIASCKKVSTGTDGDFKAAQAKLVRDQRLVGVEEKHSFRFVLGPNLVAELNRRGGQDRKDLIESSGLGKNIESFAEEAKENPDLGVRFEIVWENKDQFDLRITKKNLPTWRHPTLAAADKSPAH